MDNLHELLVHELSDLYSAEKQLVKALPKMAKGVTNEKLKSAIEEHLAVTEEQVARLEQVFKLLDEKPKRIKCKGMEGLIKEGAEMLDEDADPALIDAGIITAAQRVEHYEMAAYGCARAFAEKLGRKDVVKLLQKTLDEEGDADKTLTEIAESEVNDEAFAIAQAE